MNYFVPRAHDRRPQGLNPTVQLHTPAQVVMAATRESPEEAARRYQQLEEQARLEQLLDLLRHTNRQTLSPKLVTVYDMFIPSHPVGVPTKYLRSEQVLRQTGVAISGNPYLDEAIYNDDTLCRLSVAGILEYFIQGAQIVIRGQSAIDRVYGIVQNYLVAWAAGAYDEQSTTDVMEIVGVPATSEKKAPLPDLSRAEEFAASLFPKTAKGIFGTRTDTLQLMQSKLTGNLQTSSKINTGSAPVERRSFSQNISKRLLDESRLVIDRPKRK